MWKRALSSFENQFLTCTVILTGDGKGMQAMGGAGSKCWLCKDPNGIVEQRGVESTSRWGAFLRSVTPDRRPGDYQHAACRILNGIAKRIETTLQAPPPLVPLVRPKLLQLCRSSNKPSRMRPQASLSGNASLRP